MFANKFVPPRGTGRPSSVVLATNESVYVQDNARQAISSPQSHPPKRVRQETEDPMDDAPLKELHNTVVDTLADCPQGQCM